MNVNYESDLTEEEDGSVEKSAPNKDAVKQNQLKVGVQTYSLFN